MNDNKKTALEIFDRLPPKGQQLINAYIDALATAPEKERKLLLRFTDALTATLDAGELPDSITAYGYLQSALELVIVARTGGSGSRTAWGIIRATIEEAQERQQAAATK